MDEQYKQSNAIHQTSEDSLPGRLYKKADLI